MSVVYHFDTRMHCRCIYRRNTMSTEHNLSLPDACTNVVHLLHTPGDGLDQGNVTMRRSALLTSPIPRGVCTQNCNVTHVSVTHGHGHSTPLRLGDPHNSPAYRLRRAKAVPRFLRQPTPVYANSSTSSPLSFIITIGTVVQLALFSGRSIA